VSYNDTSVKLSIVLDDNTLLQELECNVKISEVIMSYVITTTREKGGGYAATLENNWGIRIESLKRKHLVTTQRGGNADYPPKYHQVVQDKRFEN
jgi:hypothetical protein